MGHPTRHGVFPFETWSTPESTSYTVSLQILVNKVLRSKTFKMFMFEAWLSIKLLEFLCENNFSSWRWDKHASHLGDCVLRVVYQEFI